MENLKLKAKLSMKQMIIVCFVFAVSLALLITISYFMLYEPATEPTLPFNPNPTTDATGTDTSAPVTYVPNTEETQYNFLVIGHDRVAVLADVIMLVNYNITKGSLTIMQIPRDTYVNTGEGFEQVNSAFSSYYSSAWSQGDPNPTMAAMNKFIPMLEQNLCINIHYGAVMNLDGFVNIVDIIGGVEMNVPFDMFYEDPKQNLLIDIKKGPQTLTGAQAEGFVRFRDTFIQADIGRGNAQKIFMAAFIKKLISSIDLKTVPLIADQVIRNVTTDMDVNAMIYFARNALSLNMKNITMLTLPGSVSSVGGYVLNRKATLTVINSFFNMYSNDITDNIFDSGKVFCPHFDDYSEALYYDDKYEINYIFSADDILNNSIYIPSFGS